MDTTEIRAQLSGELITPEDAAYDEARQVFFKGFDRGPPRLRGSPAPRTSLAS